MIHCKRPNEGAKYKQEIKRLVLNVPEQVSTLCYTVKRRGWNLFRRAVAPNKFQRKVKRVTAALCTIIVMHLANRNRCQVFDTYGPVRGKHKSNFS